MAIDLTQFKRSHCCQGTATAGEITETLKQIRQFDAKSENSRRLMRWMMLFSEPCYCLQQENRVPLIYGRFSTQECQI